jgi:V-type H+-transporting ATPase subunit E
MVSANVCVLSLLRCSSGGVVVTSADGRIVVSNTLDHRVHIAYEANLPDIRGKLFGVVASGAH